MEKLCGKLAMEDRMRIALIMVHHAKVHMPMEISRKWEEKLLI